MVLENFLLKKYVKTKIPTRVESVYNALSLLEFYQGNIDIKTLQSLTNTSRKTLERAFSNYLGLKPKFYAEIIRFNNAKKLIDQSSDIDITDISYRMGYYDNSHFAAEFKRFSGQSPTEYFKNKMFL